MGTVKQRHLDTIRSIVGRFGKTSFFKADSFEYRFLLIYDAFFTHLRINFNTYLQWQIKFVRASMGTYVRACVCVCMHMCTACVQLHAHPLKLYMKNDCVLYYPIELMTIYTC